MYDFTVFMALVDYIPVTFFGITAVVLMRDLYHRMTKYEFAMLAAGTINVFNAGFLKAVWKLLYAAGICDFHALNTLFLPTQSLGFFLAGLSLVILLFGRKKAALAVTAPPVFSGTAMFLIMMVLGLDCICVCLSVLAAQLKIKKAILLFVLAFAASMGMGYAGRLDSTVSWLNWLEQGINIISQGCLLGGVWMLHRAGLRNAKEAA